MPHLSLPPAPSQLLEYPKQSRALYLIECDCNCIPSHIQAQVASGEFNQTFKGK